MARPKATPEQREQIRRSIQKAAAAIYREQGIGGISARAVAKEAGVSVGAIYAHFGDLTGLMQSLWTGHVQRQNELFEHVAKAQETPVHRIRALLTEYLRFGIENSELYRHAFMFVRPEGHEKPVPEPPTSTSFAALLKQAIEDGQEDGTVTMSHPDTIIQLLWSGLHGAIALPINFDRLDFIPSGEIADAMVEMLVKTVRV